MIDRDRCCPFNAYLIAEVGSQDFQREQLETETEFTMIVESEMFGVITVDTKGGLHELSLNSVSSTRVSIKL